MTATSPPAKEINMNTDTSIQTVHASAVLFDVSRSDTKLIAQIAKRARNLALKHDVDYPILDASMDITACHANGTPLDLQKLMGFDDGNFGHDVFGIRRFIDRTSGQLSGCFLPRCSA